MLAIAECDDLTTYRKGNEIGIKQSEQRDEIGFTSFTSIYKVQQPILRVKLLNYNKKM